MKDESETQELSAMSRSSSKNPIAPSTNQTTIIAIQLSIICYSNPLRLIATWGYRRRKSILQPFLHDAYHLQEVPLLIISKIHLVSQNNWPIDYPYFLPQSLSATNFRPSSSPTPQYRYPTVYSTTLYTLRGREIPRVFVFCRYRLSVALTRFEIAQTVQAAAKIV